MYVSPSTATITNFRRASRSSDAFNLFPPELVAHIFSYCYSNSILSPPNFTQVCSRWRSIAHSSPELWTDLEIVFPPSLKTDADALQLEVLLTEWLSRSSNLSVDLSVDGPFYRNWLDNPTEVQQDLYVKLYTNIIIGFSNKWRKLLLPYLWEAHDFLTRVDELLLVEELTLYVGTCSSSAISFPKAPRLSKLDIDLPRSPSATCLDELVPSTVIDLTLISAPGVMGLTHNFMLEFLHFGQLHTLTCLEIRKLGWRDSHVLHPLSLPNLRQLSICGLIAGLENFLDALTLPSLHTLSLETFRVSGSGNLGPRVGTALITLQKRSQFPLSVLRLTWMLDEGDMQAINLDNLSVFLSATNTISELDISAHGDTDTHRLMGILSYDQLSKPILPNLKIFHGQSLFDSTDPNCSYYVRFLASRWWGCDDSEDRPSSVCRLREFLLTGCEASDKTVQYAWG